MNFLRNTIAQVLIVNLSISAIGILFVPQVVLAATCGAGGSITFYDDVGGGQCIGVITSGTTFTTPSDWSATNSIEIIGAGGNGGNGSGGGASGRGGSGGGGGAYGVVTNTSSLSGAQTYDINIGAAHAGGSLDTTEGTWLCTTTGGGSCANVSDTDVLVGAQSGAKGGDGGPSGGAGGNSGTNKTQNGGAGASASGSNNSPGAGGGGAAGSSGDGQPGSGQSGGDGDSSTTPPGGAGATTAGAAGGNGAEWTVNSVSYGSGGAGAGNDAGAGNGGAGGQYGAGGGGGGGNGNNGGAGYQGIIVLIYTPVAVTAPTVTTDFASNVGATTATLNGTKTGGDNATEHGFAYGTDPTLATVISTTTLGALNSDISFSNGVSSLSADTTYYFRAYGTNAGGTGYGIIREFVTGNTTVARRMRLFTGFTIKLVSSRIILYQK